MDTVSLISQLPLTVSEPITYIKKKKITCVWNWNQSCAKWCLSVRSPADFCLLIIFFLFRFNFGFFFLNSFVDIKCRSNTAVNYVLNGISLCLLLSFFCFFFGSNVVELNWTDRHGDKWTKIPINNDNKTWRVFVIYRQSKYLPSDYDNGHLTIQQKPKNERKNKPTEKH